MKTRIIEYTVGQLAKQSGVSIRTLHHYDDIGLLEPAHTGTNGYRYYRQAELFRLQEILFYRDVGMPLSEIGQVLAGPETAAERLILHRQRLRDHNLKTKQLIDTLDSTIAHLEGHSEMQIGELYRPFSTDQQKTYENWLISTYGDHMAEDIHVSRAAIAARPDGMEGALEALRTIEAELVIAFEAGEKPGSPTLHDKLEAHRTWVAGMWGRDCEADGYSGLADLYTANPEFVARYETLSAQFSQWLPDAMKAHADRVRQSTA